jgi:hypothetical protein
LYLTVKPYECFIINPALRISIRNARLMADNPNPALCQSTQSASGGKFELFQISNAEIGLVTSK